MFFIEKANIEVAFCCSGLMANGLENIWNFCSALDLDSIFSVLWTFDFFKEHFFTPSVFFHRANPWIHSWCTHYPCFENIQVPKCAKKIQKFKALEKIEPWNISQKLLVEMKDNKFHLRSSLTTTLPGIWTQRSRLSKMFHLICFWVMTSSEFLRSGTWHLRIFLQVLQNLLKNKWISFRFHRWCVLVDAKSHDKVSEDDVALIKLRNFNSFLLIQIFLLDKSFPFFEPLVSVSFGKLLVFEDRINSLWALDCEQTIIRLLVS